MSWDDVMTPNYGTPAVTIAHGHGCRVWDDQGNEYIDALAGIAVSSLGHAHPAIVQAVGHQVTQVAHTSNLYAHGPGVALATRLQARFPDSRTFFSNSGGEANEAALKTVRRHAHATGRPDGVILAFHNGFHGRTTGTVALTGKPAYQAGFTPLPGQIVHLPFNDVAAIEQAFEEHVVVGVFAEMIQGEGGIIPMDPQVALTLRRLCDANDALLVIDEVQTGVGRTGRFFAFEHYDIQPDIVTLAKGIAGGLPLGVTMMRASLAALLPPGSHGSTFGGNPISCAAALAVLDVLEAENLMGHAARIGARIQQGLQAAGLSSRGRGLLLGIQVPDAKATMNGMRAAGILVGTAGDVVRLAPPLVLDASSADAIVANLVRLATPVAAE